MRSLCPSRTSFYLCGNDNTIRFDNGVKAGALDIVIRGSGNLIEVEEGSILEACRLEVWACHGRIRIGRGTHIMNASLIIAESNTDISVGEKCLIASGVEFRTGDGHGIYNSDSGKRLNNGASIKADSRVWIAKDALILKGASIPTGSVIGARSIVTGALPEANAVYVGSPAVLKRSGITWSYSIKEIQNDPS